VTVRELIQELEALEEDVDFNVLCDLSKGNAHA
jgi:hypothetical protein